MTANSSSETRVGRSGPQPDLPEVVPTSIRHDASHMPQPLAFETPQKTEVVRSLLGIEVLGIGAYLPERIVPNAELASLGIDADWILQRTGIRERRMAPPEMAASDLGASAAERCLSAAGVSPAEVDLLVVATMSGDNPTPSTACRIQHRLGARCPAFDVSAACAGFMFGLVTGMQFVKTGTARRVLVVGADVMSRTVNPSDTKTYPLFGDGAGAVLLGPGAESRGLASYLLGSDGSGGDLLYVAAGGSREPCTPAALAAGRQFMQMDGKAVFKWAVRTVADTCREAIALAGLTVQDIEHLVLHQANKRIIDAAAEDLGIDPAKVLINLDRYGNTSAASIPLALAELSAAGRLLPGQRVLTCGFGAGLAWGAAVWNW